MKFVEIKNKKILKLLDECVDAFLDRGYINSLNSLDNDIYMYSTYKSDHHPVSDEYLYECLNDDPHHWGTPRDGYLFDYINSIYRIKGIAEKDRKKLAELGKPINRLQNLLTMKSNALSAYYPDKGYIGWHHNGNASGLNILFTYSQDGDGYFKYRDTETGEIVTLKDKKGWSAKMGYYPDVEKVSKDKLFWHAAYTEKERITVAFCQKENHAMYAPLRGMLEAD